MEKNPNPSDPASADSGPPPTVTIPQREWSIHPLLHRARVNDTGDGLEWSNATFEQSLHLREVSLVAGEDGLSARLPAQFNFDRFVDARTSEYGPAHPAGHAPDRQRYYSRVTHNGFHVVGDFSAATIGSRRRYFQWLTGAWIEIGLRGFLYVRDDLDSHFSEVTAKQLEENQPGASTAPLIVDVEADLEDPTGSIVVESVPEQVATPTSDWDALLQRGIAVALATTTYRGAIDLVGAAHIDHVVRVAERFDPVQHSVRHCAAWLHDVFELSDLSSQDLLDAGVAPAVVDVVTVLTSQDNIPHDDYLANIAVNSDALAVKLAALDDNGAVWRMRKLDGETRLRLEREHAKARAILAGTP